MSDQINMSDVLASNYMLASLTIPKWTGEKKDDRATAELTAQKGAVSDAATVVKKLLAGNEAELKDCLAAYDRIRTWFYANSLPWTSGGSQNRGSRLVGTVQAMTFLRDFANLKTQAEAALEKFLDSYDSAVQNTAASLGGLYDPSEYPSKEALRGKFGAYLSISPMPAVGDFDRISIPGAMAQGLKGLYERHAQKQIDAAVEDCQQRLVDELQRMATQLSKEANGEKVRLYQSLVDNMRTVSQLAASLGPLRPELADISAEINAKLLNVQVVGDYKGNAPLARRAAETAAELAARLSAPVNTDTDTDTNVDMEVTALAEATAAPVTEPLVTSGADFDFDPDSVFDVGV